jgi:multidrug efflux system membrane fusion protein
VFVVKPDNTAEMRNVTVSISQGNLTAIAQGIKPNENVVTDGQDKLQPGTKVEIRGGAKPNATPAQADEGQGQ